MFYLSAIFGMLMLVFSLLSVLLSRYRLHIDALLSSARTPHGESVEMQLTIGQSGILPISPVEINVCCGDETRCQIIQPRFRQSRSCTLTLPARHIGAFRAGVSGYSFTDILGLFQIKRSCEDAMQELLVLPRSFDVQPLRFMSADDGRSLQNRTTEDPSSPEDTRTYRSGDALKRIHWKLTARRRELVVRKYETPAPPDTLILLDCTLPGGPEDTAEVRASLRDALCETALSVALMQMRGDSPVRVPLYGEAASEFLSDRSGHAEILQELLSRQPFWGGVEFSRVLHLELRRMRRTGATVIITTRLNAGIVEGVKHIRRMGPAARVYLITRTPDRSEDRPYVAQLQQCLVEVCYVTPA